MCYILLWKLELMFMKHYAPNRCLYKKVAKLRTKVGSAEMSHLQYCSLKIYLKESTGGGGGGDRVGGVRMDVNEELKFCENSKKKWGGGVRGVGSGGGGVRVDVNDELKLFVKIQKQWGGWSGVGGGGAGRVWGSGWM